MDGYRSFASLRMTIRVVSHLSNWRSTLVKNAANAHISRVFQQKAITHKTSPIGNIAARLVPFVQPGFPLRAD